MEGGGGGGGEMYIVWITSKVLLWQDLPCPCMGCPPSFLFCTYPIVCPIASYPGEKEPANEATPSIAGISC